MNRIMHVDQPGHTQTSDFDLGRRDFLGRGAALGAAAGALALNSTLALSEAQAAGPNRAGAPGIQPLVVDSPMARWKEPQSLEFVTGATELFSFPN
jgi:hypothetical protein